MSTPELSPSGIDLDLSVPGPHSQALLDSQAKNESNARTYSRRLPIAIAEASGSYITDVDGRVYIDFLSGAGVLALGHNHPEMVSAVQKQLTKITHGLDFPTPIREEFKRRQLEMLPATIRDKMKIHFCGPTGGDGVEAAVKLCKIATGRGGVIAFQGSYHGSTQGAMSLTSDTQSKAGLHNLLPGVHFTPYAYCHRCPLNLSADTCGIRCAELLVNTLDDTHGGVPKPAAIIVELVQGEGGTIPAPVEFVQRVATMASERDIPLIVDEVQTGCGRTGSWFTFEQYGFEPDVIVASKGLSGLGLPVSIIMYNERLDVWSPGSHIGTFRGNNLAFASGIAYLEVLEREDLLENVRTQGSYLLAELATMQQSSSLISDVRGLGLMLGVEMRGQQGAITATPSEIAFRMQRAALRNGLILEIGGRENCVVRMLPPLNLTRRTADEALAAFSAGLRSVQTELAERD